MARRSQLALLVVVALPASSLLRPSAGAPRASPPRAAAAASYEAYLEAAGEAAVAAGRLIASAKAADKAVEKSKFNAKDLLTATDVACQAEVAGLLAARFPESRLLGEEDVAPGAASSRAAAAATLGGDARFDCVWVVDPIDGTANFVDSIPLSTVSVAAVEKPSASAPPRVVAGVVYDPHRDELFGASLGGGAWVARGAAEGQGPLPPASRRERLEASAASRVDDAIVYAGAPPNPDALAPSLRGIAAVAPRCRTLRLLGSAALMLAYVAAGRGAAYFEADLSAWDTAAGALLVHEAGGRVSDARGVAYDPGSTRQILATNARIHDDLQALLATVSACELDGDELLQ